MSITPLDRPPGPVETVRSARDALLHFAGHFADSSYQMSSLELANTVAAVEELSRTVEYLQILGAHAIEKQNVAGMGETPQRITWSPAAAFGGPVRTEFRDTPDYLRARLLIGRAEARRRLRLGAAVVTPRFLSGSPGEARLPHLSTAMAAGEVGVRAAVLINDSVERVRPAATNPQARQMIQSMERALTMQAAESDLDVLGMVARHWEAALDPDGREPTDELLRSRQGVFFKGKRNGLHRLEITATEGQFEALSTAMYTATNPRTVDIDSGGGAGDEGGSVDKLSGEGAEPADESIPDGRTRAQQLLDGLVGACRVALTTADLPASGGHRPQVMVTIGFDELVGKLKGTGYAVFGGPVTAATVRRIACDAEVIPLVLGRTGEILDVGRSHRFFGPGLRRALVARDKGCGFPDCTIPAVWCEAHHITPWYAAGRTTVNNGVLLCGHHHDLVEQGNWRIDVLQGIPWFIPPPYVDPGRKPRRNRYRHVGTVIQPD